jgi:hypothetical protein
VVGKFPPPADMPVEDFMSIYLFMGASSSQYISPKV